MNTKSQTVGVGIQREPCTWTQDADGAWNTTCGEAFYLDTGTPNENKLKFCCYCGAPLEEGKQ